MIGVALTTTIAFIESLSLVRKDKLISLLECTNQRFGCSTFIGLQIKNSSYYKASRKKMRLSLILLHPLLFSR